MPFENFHAARIVDPDKFQDDSFRTITIGDKADGITAIVGRLKGETTTTIQTYRFDKDKWSASEAKKWLKDHDVNVILFEPASADEGSSQESSEKSESKKMEHKVFSFTCTNVRETKNDDGNFGIVNGYISTYNNSDLANDIIEKGAFSKTLKKYKSKNKPLPLHYMHDYLDVIGGFPIDQIKDDEKGLLVEGHINLDVQRGREAYSLAKQGVLSDFSIGFRTIKERYSEKTRYLEEIELYEASLVTHPANEEAQVLQVKSIKYDISHVLDIKTKKEFEDILRESGIFSKQAATYLASSFNPESKQSESVLREESNNAANILAEIKQLINNL